jgi:phospholipase C
MGGSSAGLDDSPHWWETGAWESGLGIEYENGSIFDLLKSKGLAYRLYNDFGNDYAEDTGDDTGSLAIVSGLDHITMTDVHFFSGFSDDINQQYPWQYTWIEPNYGDAVGDFTGGSSQHPQDSLLGGEKMLAALYNDIRSSPYWPTSLLIVTYDEHGGYYDHVAPPAATPPGDKPWWGSPGENDFDFSQYGVRVPAVVVSPLIPGGTVDHTLYDHTSILKTIETLYHLPSLTKRDAGANAVVSLLSLDQPRANTIPQFIVSSGTSTIGTTGSNTSSKKAVPDPALELDTAPLPEKGNIHGFLQIAAKTDYELSDRSEATRAAIIARVKSIQTKGDARAYIREVLEKVKSAKATAKTAGTVG